MCLVSDPVHKESRPGASRVGPPEAWVSYQSQNSQSLTNINPPVVTIDTPSNFNHFLQHVGKHAP